MRRRIFRRRGPTGFGRFRSKRGLHPSRNLRLCSRTCCCATCGICGCGWWNRGSMRALSVLGFLLLGGSIWAQQYVISTIAGGAPPATPSLAPTASIGDPTRLATDAAGNVYFGSLHSLFKVDAGGTLTRVAGNARPGNSGDGGPAATAQLNFPMGIAVDAAGNVFVADRDASVVRKIAANGNITTVAGNGTPGFTGDGGAAVSAQINGPFDVAVDSSGDLYIADTGNEGVAKGWAAGTH